MRTLSKCFVPAGVRFPCVLRIFKQADGSGNLGIDTGRWGDFYRLTWELSAKQNVLDSSFLKKVLHCLFMMRECSSKPGF